MVRNRTSRPRIVAALFLSLAEGLFALLIIAILFVLLVKIGNAQDTAIVELPNDPDTPSARYCSDEEPSSSAEMTWNEEGSCWDFREITPSTLDANLIRRVLEAQREHHYRNMLMLYAETKMLRSEAGREYLARMTEAEKTSESLQALITAAEEICSTVGKDFNRQSVSCVDKPTPPLAKLLGN